MNYFKEETQISPNHFYINNWQLTTFLPMFKFTFAHKMKCGDCPLAAYQHPLVRNKENEHMYHKLCTLQVIKAGLLKLETVFLDSDGCGRQPDDYQRAKQMLSNKRAS